MTIYYQRNNEGEADLQLKKKKKKKRTNKSSSYLSERQQNLAFHVLGILEYTSFPFLILQLTIKFRVLNNHNDNKDNLCKLTCVYDQMRISLIQGP